MSLNIVFATAKVKTIQANRTVASITGGAPYAVTTTAAHGYETGDIVAISCLPGQIFTITVTSATVFTLNETAGSTPLVCSGIVWSPTGATVTHLGYATPSQSTAAIAAGTSFTYEAYLNTLSGGYFRIEFEDGTGNNFNLEQPGPTACSPQGPISGGYSVMASSNANYQGMQTGASGDVMRAKVYLDGGPGTSATFSASLQ